MQEQKPVIVRLICVCMYCQNLERQTVLPAVFAEVDKRRKVQAEHCKNMYAVLYVNKCVNSY